MTDSISTNPNAIGGSAESAATHDELTSGVVIDLKPSGKDLQTLASDISRAIEWSLTSKTDVGAATKYPGSPYNSYIGGGSFSMTPLLGKFIFSSAENEESSPIMKVDKSSSSFASTASNTTLGSKNIDTVDGYEMTKTDRPSSSFTPQKTWIRSIFSTLADSKLLQLAFLEGIQLLLLSALKGTKSEQIVKRDPEDLGTTIVNNQEIEDRMLASYYSRHGNRAST